MRIAIKEYTRPTSSIRLLNKLTIPLSGPKSFKHWCTIINMIMPSQNLPYHHCRLFRMVKKYFRCHVMAHMRAHYIVEKVGVDETEVAIDGG
jgi:hypothetical protein